MRVPEVLNTVDEVLRRCERTGAWYGEEISRIDQRNFMEDTVLHTVCTWGDQGSTPLFNAVMGRNAEVVALLLKAGADKTILNGWGSSVAEYAKNVSAGPAIIALLCKR